VVDSECQAACQAWAKCDYDKNGCGSAGCGIRTTAAFKQLSVFGATSCRLQGLRIQRYAGDLDRDELLTEAKVGAQLPVPVK
jgi:hypothetical protein